MNIYSCVDYQNIDKIFVLFYSVFVNSNHKDKLKFFILTDNHLITPIPDFLSNSLKIGIIKFDDYWQNILNMFNENFYKKSTWCKSNLNFARFFIFEFFPEIDRIIYLDWDMIVQTDIYKLKKEYENDKMIVAEMPDNWSIFDNVIEKNSKVNVNYLEKVFKVSFSKKSFNSGMYIVNKNHFNLEKLSILITRLIKLQSKHNIFKFGTQVIMNLFPYELEFIDKKWNTSLVNPESLIIHWCGNKKPWNNNDECWYNYYNKLYSIQSKSEKNLKNETKKSIIKSKNLLKLF